MKVAGRSQTAVLRSKNNHTDRLWEDAVRSCISARIAQLALRVLTRGTRIAAQACVIRKLKTGEFRLYSRKANPKTGRRRNLGTFSTREKAEQHERAIQYFKRH